MTRPRSKPTAILAFALVAIAAGAVASGSCFRNRAADIALPYGGAEDPYVGHLSWLAGSWVSIEEDTVVEEHWAAPRGGMLVGMARTTVGGRVTFWEFMQIFEDGDRIIFQPWPKGEEDVPFYLSEAEPNRAVFANPNNDFPSVIEYRRSGDRLEAVLTGVVRGSERKETFTWQRYDIAQ